eukprot:m.69983 g.69983  ORF g.69983 m.69983 type:complete len:329 (+) comp14280_c0_seq1:217-1203(+)
MFTTNYHAHIHTKQPHTPTTTHTKSIIHSYSPSFPHSHIRVYARYPCDGAVAVAVGLCCACRCGRTHRTIGSVQRQILLRLVWIAALQQESQHRALEAEHDVEPAVHRRRSREEHRVALVALADDRVDDGGLNHAKEDDELDGEQLFARLKVANGALAGKEDDHQAPHGQQHGADVGDLQDGLQGVVHAPMVILRIDTAVALQLHPQAEEARDGHNIDKLHGHLVAERQQPSFHAHLAAAGPAHAAERWRGQVLVVLLAVPADHGHGSVDAAHLVQQEADIRVHRQTLREGAGHAEHAADTWEEERGEGGEGKDRAHRHNGQGPPPPW